MEQKKIRKKGGRPRLPEDERRQNVTLMLTPLEVEQLRKEHQGHLVEFGVFLREKLMGREAVTLSKPIDPVVRQELTNALKMSSMILLLAKRTEYDVLVSKKYQELSNEVKTVIKLAMFNMRELVLSKSFLPVLLDQVQDLKCEVLKLQNELPGNKAVFVLFRSFTELEDKINTFLKQHGIVID